MNFTSYSSNISKEKQKPPGGITNAGKKRILKDVIQIMKNPLHDQGIFYKHDENDIKKGYAMIIGPKDTPYQNGMYFFSFNFPDNYPFSPPKVKYKTNDGNIRFNPNLYEDEKVCLSILNTWEGEQWTSCQTISSVLLTIVSILNNEPFLNEPQMTRDEPDFEVYHKTVEWGNINVAIFGIIKLDFQFYSELFVEEIINHLKKNGDEILKQLKDLNDKYRDLKRSERRLYVDLYNVEIIDAKKSSVSVSDFKCFMNSFLEMHHDE